MDVHFYDKIQVQISTLHDARDVAATSFVYQKSVHYLDLNTNEYGLCKESVFTREDMRKRIQPKRQILYQYNLDLPTDLEKSFSNEKYELVLENAFHHKRFISESVYNRGFETHIVHAINSQKTNKIEKLKRSMKIIKLLRFNRLSTPAMYLYDNILPFLMRERCTDWKLVVNFANLFSFYFWITNRECPEILWYVLDEAQKVGSIFSLTLFTEQSIDTVNACLFQHKIKNVPILLRFGAPTAFPCASDFYFLLHRAYQVFHQSILSRCANERRAFFLLQLLYDFYYHPNSQQGLQSIWRSIDDSFLSLKEIISALIPPLPIELVVCLIAYYQLCIIEENCTYEYSPRTLKHICRVEVRRLLNFNHQLPFGIDKLEIPNELKDFLNLLR